jgi:superfamily II DNA or RNA helicase
MIDLKQLSIDDYRDVFKEVNFILEPRWHQFVSLAYGLDKNRIFYFHDVGTGKTITALYMMMLWKCKRILVICTRSAFPAWERDIPKATNYSYTILEGSPDERVANLNSRCDISIINYEGLKTLYADKYPGGWMINHHSFIHDFDGIIVDEVHHLNNAAALQALISRKLSNNASKVIGMTGTEIDGSLLELWHIFFFLDGGTTFGNNFWSFRGEHFFKDKYRKWLWHPKMGSDNYILTRAGRSAIVFDRDECEDLPPKDTLIYHVQPTAQYLNMQQAIAEQDNLTLNGITLENKHDVVKGHRLAQLSSGFIYLNNTGTESRRVFEFDKQPKVETLLDILNETNKQLVVYHSYTHEAVLIERALKAKHISFTNIRGSTKDPNKSYKDFVDSKKRVMIAHKLSGGESYDFTNTTIGVYYSPVASPRIRTQTEGRIHRDGQTHKTLFIDLTLKGSIDERTNANRAQRKRFVDTVREFLKELAA